MEYSWSSRNFLVAITNELKRYKIISYGCNRDHQVVSNGRIDLFSVVIRTHHKLAQQRQFLSGQTQGFLRYFLGDPIDLEQYPSGFDRTNVVIQGTFTFTHPYLLGLGGNGFIGTQVVDKLYRQGHYITVVDRDPTPKLDVDVQIVEDDYYSFISSTRQHFDTVIHLAADMQVEQSVKDPKSFYTNNVMKMKGMLLC